MCRVRERHTHRRVCGQLTRHTGAVMSRVLLVVLFAALGVSTGCSSGERSCSDLRAELQQVTGGTAVDVSKWDDMDALQQVVTKALELQSEIDRRCG